MAKNELNLKSYFSKKVSEPSVASSSHDDETPAVGASPVQTRKNKIVFTTWTPATLPQVSLLPKAALVNVVLFRKLRISRQMFQIPRYVIHIIAKIKVWARKSVMTEKSNPTGLSSILGYLSALQRTEFIVQPAVVPRTLAC